MREGPCIWGSMPTHLAWRRTFSTRTRRSSPLIPKPSERNHRIAADRSRILTPGGRLCRVLDALKRQAQSAIKSLRAIGLSGHMHGAVLLDKSEHVLRPRILWNEMRAYDACKISETRFPESRQSTRKRAVFSFTTPKMIWIKNDKPEIFRQINKILLPKA